MSISDAALGALLLVSSVAVSFAIVCGWLWYQEHRRQKRWAAADARMNAQIAAMRAAAAPLYRELRYQRRLDARAGTVTWCSPQEKARPIERFEKGLRNIVVDALPIAGLLAFPVLPLACAVLDWRRTNYLYAEILATLLLFGAWAIFGVWELWRAWPWRPGDVVYWISAMTTLLGFGDILSHLRLSNSGPILPSLLAAIGVGCIGLAGCVVIFLVDFRHREPQQGACNGGQNGRASQAGPVPE